MMKYRRSWYTCPRISHVLVIIGLAAKTTMVFSFFWLFALGLFALWLVVFGIPFWLVFVVPNMLGVLIYVSLESIPWDVFYFYWPLYFVLYVAGWLGALFFVWLVAVWGANRVTGRFSGNSFWRTALALYAGVQGVAILGFRLAYPGEFSALFF